MAKKISGYIKLNIPAGAANPSPPVGPALGQRGVNIMEFCKAFNAATDSLEKNMPIPVVITVFADKSFSYYKIYQKLFFEENKWIKLIDYIHNKKEKIYLDIYDDYGIAILKKKINCIKYIKFLKLMVEL